MNFPLTASIFLHFHLKNYTLLKISNYMWQNNKITNENKDCLFQARAAVTPDFCESESSVGSESQNQENDSKILRVKSRVNPNDSQILEFDLRVDSQLIFSIIIFKEGQ
jgi:hypothetical protein